MKFMKGLTVGILIGILLTGSAFAAVQYNLSESEWKVVVDGQPVQDERYPVLLLPPGYNYMAVGSLRSVCEKAGIPFEADVPTKEVRITTTKTVATKSALNPQPTIAPTSVGDTYSEPYTIERDGVKKVFLGDLFKLLKPTGYYFENSAKDGNYMNFYGSDDGIIFRDIPFTVHDYNGDAGCYIDFQFFIDNIKPLIKQ